jgi:hypothetical protein
MALLQKIRTISRRLVQLEGGPGNNQPARASDVNPIIEWVNDRSDVNTVANVATGNAVTLNTISGTVTSGALTLTAAAPNEIVVTNAYCTVNSTVLVVVTTGPATNNVTVAKVVPANGSFTATFVNLTGAITGTITFKFIIL